jgi:hypothetical protein
VSSIVAVRTCLWLAEKANVPVNDRLAVNVLLGAITSVRAKRPVPFHLLLIVNRTDAVRTLLAEKFLDPE